MCPTMAVQHAWHVQRSLKPQVLDCGKVVPAVPVFTQNAYLSALCIIIAPW